MRLICFLIMPMLFMNIAFAACPSNADTDAEFKNIVKRAYLDYMHNIYISKITRAELKDLINFYLTTSDWGTADCSLLGTNSGMSVQIITNQVQVWVDPGIVPTCSDATEYGDCSATKPKYCYAGNLIDKCSVCGCDPGYDCVDEVCQEPSCSDGTLYSQCSVTKPKYCDDGNLIDDCQTCGCPSEHVCQGDGTCIANTGLGDPVLNPSYPEDGETFQIECPANNNTYDCIMAFYNETEECVFSHWDENNVVFDCPAMSLGQYTAKCEAVPETASNCNADEKNITYYVNGLTLVLTGATPSTYPSDEGIQTYVTITTHPGELSVPSGFAMRTPSDPNPELSFVLPNKTFLLEVREVRTGYPYVPAHNSICGPNLVTLPSYGKYTLSTGYSYSSSDTCSIVGATAIDMKGISEPVSGVISSYGSALSGAFSVVLSIQEATGTLTEFYVGSSINTQSMLGVPYNYDYQYGYYYPLIPEGTAVEGSIAAGVQDYRAPGQTDIYPYERYRLWSGGVSAKRDYPLSAYSFSGSMSADPIPVSCSCSAQYLMCSCNDTTPITVTYSAVGNVASFTGVITLAPITTDPEGIQQQFTGPVSGGTFSVSPETFCYGRMNMYAHPGPTTGWAGYTWSFYHWTRFVSNFVPSGVSCNWY